MGRALKTQDITLLQQLIDAEENLSLVSLARVLDSYAQKKIELNTQFVKLLIENNVDIIDTDNYGDNSFINATLFGNFEIVRLLLEKGLSINTKSDNGKTALFIALEYGYIDIAEYLIEQGIDIEGKNGSIALAWSMVYKTNKILKVLMKNEGANNKFTFEEYSTCGLFELLEEKGAKLNFDMIVKEEIYYILFSMSILLSDKELLQLFLDHGADVNQKIKMNEMEMPPFAFMAMKDVMLKQFAKDGIQIDISTDKKETEEIFKIFLDYGADINQKIKIDEKEIPAIYFAILFSNKQMVRLFLEHGADVNQKIKIGENEIPLLAFVIMKDFIMKYGLNNENKQMFKDADTTHDKEILKLLLEHGADVNQKIKIDNTEMSLIVFLIQFGKVEILEILIEHGIDIHQTYEELTPLFIAISMGKVAMVKLLIEKGIDITTTGGHGTPLMVFINKKFKEKKENIHKDSSLSIIEKEQTLHGMASSEDYNEIIKLLVQAIVNLDMQDSNLGWTGLMVAVEKEDYEITKFLLESGVNVNKYILGTLTLYKVKNKKIRDLLLSYSARSVLSSFQEWKYEYQKNKPKIDTKELYSEELKLQTLEKEELKLQRIENRKTLYKNRAITKALETKDILLLQEALEEEKSFENINIIDLIKENYSLEFIELVLQNKGIVNVRDSSEATPLMHALRLENEELIKLLLLYGADVNLVNQNDEDSVDVALSLLNQNFLDLILEKQQQSRHEPKMLVQLLSNFTRDTPLKYTTHMWDFGDIKKSYQDFKGFIKALSQQFYNISNDLEELSPNLHKKIYDFILNPQKASWCSKDKNLNIGWSSLQGLDEWCNNGQNPFDFELQEKYTIDKKEITTFGEVINLFKQEIEIRNENNMLENIFFGYQKKLGRKFHFDFIKLKGRTFYTDVATFTEVLDRIFGEMKKRENYPNISIECQEIDEKCFDIKISQIDSPSNKNFDILLKEVEDGDFKEIRKSLANLCDWSIESSFANVPFRINYLKQSSLEYILEKEIQMPIGFTHIMRFYKK